MSNISVDDRHPPLLFLGSFIRTPFERRDRFDRYLREGFVVADIGAGAGYYTFHAARKVGENGLVYAIESNPRALPLLERKAERLGCRNVRIVVSSAASMDAIPSRSVDFVISNLTLCCLVDHAGAVNEMRRIMKDGALAYVSVTRMGLSSDPRRVNEKEFEQLISSFTVKERKIGKFILSAIVRKDG
ncbi:MAG: class I SAM-dependent methyltransferase [Methanomassiliicoccales archaeon]